VVDKIHKVTTVGMIGLGCPKNQVDTERMLAHIAQSGLVISSDPERAEVVVINTCGFIRPAIDESIDAIRWAMRLKMQGSAKKVIVCGCLAQRLGQGLFRKVKGIDALVGLSYRDQIAQIILQTLSDTKKRTYLDDTARPLLLDDSIRVLVGPGHTAYLRLSEGCSHHCSFCTIPSIRGPHASKPLKQVLQEAKHLVQAGVRELIVIGQDITAYLKDQGIKDGLVRLIEGLDRLDGLAWARLMYLYPSGLTGTLIKAMAASSKVVHYVDLPIQHVDDQILKAMRRPDTARSLRMLIEELKTTIPDMILRTTLIVGFPGETQAQFESLLEFIRWARFDALGCFPFYSEPGTPAASLPGQVPSATKRRRYDLVMKTQQQIALEKNLARIGSVLTCIVDQERSRRTRIGRFYGQAPQIDSNCLIRNCHAKPGTFVKAKVTDARPYELVCDCVDQGTT